MVKAYITAPYTSKSIGTTENSYGQITDLAYKNFLESIDSIIRSCGLETILPHRDTYEWGTITLEPKRLMRQSFENLKQCDVLVAYPENSKGVNIIIGWASMMNKKIIILQTAKENVSIVHAGLDAIAETKIVKFTDIAELRTKLKDVLNSFVPHH